MTAHIDDPPEHDLEREQDFVEREDCQDETPPAKEPCGKCKACKDFCPLCGADLITKRAGDESWRVCRDACGFEEN